jgi:outer membrane protein OmpA-like peptidoglycan-associated protein
MNADNTKGYFSSSREGDKDKLYMFSKVKDLFAQGAVYNKKTNELLVFTMVEIKNQTSGKKEVVYTDNNGKFNVPLARNADYTFDASKENFMPGHSIASTFGEIADENINVRIELEDMPVPEPVYVAEIPVPLSNVYFDLDKWNIRREAASELDGLAEHMLNNPEMKLEIGAHADTRGTDPYNMELSRKRAMVIVDYLVKAGVDKNRINAKWYGKSRPVNGCMDGVNCSPEKHQLNRRVEFKQIDRKIILHPEDSYTDSN